MSPSTPETRSTIDDVLRLRDGVGVLSVYVGIDPTAEAHARPPWQIQLDKDVRGIRKGLRSEKDHGRRVAVDERLTVLEPQLEDLLDATEPGRGRALFAGVESGEVHIFHLQLELPTGATLGEVAHVLPLLRVDDGRSSAIVLLGRDTVRVLETRLGRENELRRYDVEPVVYDRAEKKGPVSSTGRGQRSVTQRERWDRHVEAEHHRRLKAVGEELGRLARARGWELAVVAGDPRGTRIPADALERAGIPTELVDRDLIDDTAAHAHRELAPVLAAAGQRRNLALVEGALDAAAAGGRGAAGLESVLAALDESRVERHLLDGDGPPAGAVGADGQLTVLDGAAPPDPEFADRLVLRARETGAPTTVVAGAAGAALAGAGGIAAILRD